MLLLWFRCKAGEAVIQLPYVQLLLTVSRTLKGLLPHNKCCLFPFGVFYFVCLG